MKRIKLSLPIRTLNLKIGLAYGILAFLGALVILGLSYAGSVRGIYQGAQERISVVADSIVYNAAVLASHNDIFTLQRLVEKSSTLLDVEYVAITDTSGKIIAHSRHELIGQRLESDLVTHAIADRVEQEIVGETQMAYVLPLRGDTYTSEHQDVYGALWVQMDLTGPLERVRSGFLWVALAGALVMLFMFPWFYIITRELILKRLVKLEMGLNLVQSGDLTARVDASAATGQGDEINLLGERFNQMTATLSERRQEIQTQRDFALQVMGSMGQGLAILGSDHRLEYVNNAFIELLSFPADTYSGKMISDFVVPAHSAQVQILLSTPERAFTFEIDMIRADEKIVHVLVSAARRMEGERASGTILVVTDLTARANLEQMKSDFINRASHELRTPITTAILMMDLLDREVENSENVEYWLALKDSIDRQKELVESLLLLGRIESNRYKVNVIPTELSPILSGVVSDLSQQAGANAVDIDLRLEPDLPIVQGSEQGLKDVFTNLLANAIKFSRPRTTVQVSAAAHGGGVMVSVRDQGIGIPAEDLPHLFTRFFRASNATVNEIQGSGLGLYIVRTIITELGGRVAVESVLNEGTTFKVFLHCADIDLHVI